MSTVFDFLAKGGPVMVPIVGASVLTLSCALERSLFWSDLLRQQGKVIHDVLAAATRDLDEAAAIANQHQDNPMGRFLLAPLKLRNASPETFRLAMETAADREFIKMRRGDKLLETIVAISPLLGLLGTVTGLIGTFYSLDIGGGGGEGAGEAAAGIGEALITTAAGMVVAILALVVLRTMVTFQSQQTDQFADAGNELELIYRQYWYEPALLAAETSQAMEGTRTPEPILRGPTLRDPTLRDNEHQR